MQSGDSSERDWAELRQLIPGYDPDATAGPGDWFDDPAADLVVDFFHECLTHIEGALAGKPFLLEPWQQAVLGNLFGWKRSDGTRRYREALIYCARKSGKTPMAAGIALFVLFCDEEQGQQNVVAAADREQASLLYRYARGMVEAEPELRERAKVYHGLGQRSITIEAENSGFRVISADATTKHGGNLHLAIVDELHCQPNRDLVDVIQTSMASANRRQPLLVHITTADFQRESICNEKHDYASKVRDGIIEDRALLPVIYEAPADADWTDPEVWALANPNLGVSVSLDYLERECKRAQETPAYENAFRRFHLNIITEQDVRWLPVSDWDACRDTELRLEDLAGEECFAALDMSSTRDLTCLGLLFPKRGNAYFPLFFVPADNAQKRERHDKVPYLTWAREGHLTLTPGNVVDYEHVKEKVFWAAKTFNLRELAIDRWNAEYMAQLLGAEGIEVIGFGQGYQSMSPAMKQVEKLLLTRELRHAGNPLMRWNFSNVAVEMDATENVKPSKKKSTERIDGVVSLVMCVGRAIVTPEKKRSVYEDGPRQMWL